MLKNCICFREPREEAALEVRNWALMWISRQHTAHIMKIHLTRSFVGPRFTGVSVGFEVSGSMRNAHRIVAMSMNSALSATYFPTHPLYPSHTPSAKKQAKWTSILPPSKAIRAMPIFIHVFRPKCVFAFLLSLLKEALRTELVDVRSVYFTVVVHWPVYQCWRGRVERCLGTYHKLRIKAVPLGMKRPSYQSSWKEEIVD